MKINKLFGLMMLFLLLLSMSSFAGNHMKSNKGGYFCESLSGDIACRFGCGDNGCLKKSDICSDSDGLDYNVKGFVTLKHYNKTVEKYDRCSKNHKRVIEQICKNGAKVSKRHKCSGICEDGACKTLICPIPNCVGGHKTGQVDKYGCDIYSCKGHCAGEGEYESGSTAPKRIMSCCDGLSELNTRPGAEGFGPLCYDPNKGTPICRNANDRSEGWYYPNGDLLKFDSCSNRCVVDADCSSDKSCDNNVCVPSNVEKSVTMGTILNINSSNLNGLHDGFYHKPTIRGYYKDPITQKDRRLGLKVLTKVSPKAPQSAIDVQWTRKVKLYNQRQMTRDANDGKTIDQSLINQKKSLEIELKLNVMSKDRTKIKDLSVEKIKLVPPTITSVDYSGALSFKTILTIHGNYLGTKKSNVYIEYKDNRGRIKYQKCGTGLYDDNKLITSYPNLRNNIATGNLVVDNGIGKAYKQI